MLNKKIKKSCRSFFMILMISVFFLLFAYFIFLYIFKSDNWALFPSNRHIYSNGEIVHAGTITDRSGVILAQTLDGKRVFCEDEDIRIATLHTVGDLSGFISTGIHTSYREELTGYDKINGLYSYKSEGCDISLTLDAEMCAKAYAELDGFSGTIGVYNYKTGEILCMVSSPSYDINSGFSGDGEEAEGIYMNRFISSSFTPGSTFKIVTACAALGTLDDAYTREYTCSGGAMVAGEWVACTGNHGNISLKEAFAVSCNSYFSQLTVDLGKDTMTEYAEKLGFNGEFELDGIKALKSSYNVDDARTIDFAWSGIGQYKDLFNPLQYMTAMGAIANGGIAKTPYFIESIKNEFGITVYSGKNSKELEMLDSSTANSVAALMDYAVETNYSKSKFGNLNVCAKTGTAEIGKEDIPHSVFVGFVDDSELPLAFAAIVENGGSGNVRALNAVAEVLKFAELKYK